MISTHYQISNIKKGFYYHINVTATNIDNKTDTVKLGDKERFDKEQISVKEPFPVTKCQLPYKNKEHLALGNNFRVTKKFLITKLDCT